MSADTNVRVQRRIWYRRAECVAPDYERVRSRMYLARNGVIASYYADNDFTARMARSLRELALSATPMQ